MRNLAPAFILTTIVAFASGSALALGDMSKNQKSPSSETTSQVTTPSSSSSYNTAPAAPNAPTSSYTAPTTPSTSSEGTSKPSVSIEAPMGATSSSVDAMPLDKDKSKQKTKQVAQNDGRCDASKYPNANDVPKDCLEKSGTGAAAAAAPRASRASNVV